MRNSNIVSATFLGIFASVCFIGGFFTGEYATYNEKVIADMYKHTNHITANIQEVINFGLEVHQLKNLIQLQKTSGLDKYINLKRKYLSNEIQKWETKLEKDEYKPYSIMINSEIMRAKVLIDSTNKP